ncbi:MAG: type III pantothenate kinase [Desulfovibrionaceae bacterium]
MERRLESNSDHRGVAALLDIGNTSVKLALADRERILASASLPSRGARAAGLAESVRTLAGEAGLAAGAIGGMVVSSVVPGLDPEAREAAALLGAGCRFVPADLAPDIENRYARPQEVGADRLVGAFAARELFPQAERIVVVDFGTATTFDCVVGRAYLGGLICPGVLSSTRSLREETAKLPEATLEIDPSGLRLGRSTLDSLNQGLVHGFAAMVEGLVRRMEPVIGGEALVVATGGFSRRIRAVCPAIHHVRPELLMDGLRLLWAAGR